ncbi:hypothetical protein ACFLZV_05210, partial [Candidatus Margulisiibacteriota bacterium]
VSTLLLFLFSIANSLELWAEEIQGEGGKPKIPPLNIVIDVAGSYSNVADGNDKDGIDKVLKIARKSPENDYELWFKGGQEYLFDARVDFPSNVRCLFFPGAHLVNKKLLSFPETQVKFKQNCLITNLGNMVLKGSVKFEMGARINNSGTVMLSDAYIIAPPKQHIFQDNGRFSGSINNSEVFPEWWGAKANDQEPDDKAIQQAFKVIKDKGGKVVLGSGTYKCNSQINGYHKNSMEGQGIDITTLDFEGAKGNFPNGACLYFAGEGLDWLSGLKKDIEKNAKVISFRSKPDFQQDDILIIYNSDDFSFSKYRDYYRAGEFARVVKVSGSEIEVETPTYAGYKANKAVSLYKQRYITVKLSDFSVKGQGAKGNQCNIKIVDGYRCEVSNLKSYNSDYCLLALNRCFDCNVNNVYGTDYSKAIGLNYGLAIGNSQRITVSGCKLATTRHSITVGGGDDIGDVPNRELLFVNNILGGTGSSGLECFDIHGNSEQISVIANTFLNGMSICANDVSIRGNNIRTSATGFGILIGESKNLNLFVDNNVFELVGKLDHKRGIIDAQLGPKLTEKSTLTIRNNRFNINRKSKAGCAINVWNVSSKAKIDCDISGNSILGYASTNGKLGIRLRAEDGYAFNELKLSDNYIQGNGIYLMQANPKNLFLKNNLITNPEIQGILITLNHNPVNEEYMEVIGNSVKNAGATGMMIQGSSKASVAVVKDNTVVDCMLNDFTNSSSLKAACFVDNFQQLFFRDNIIGNISLANKLKNQYVLKDIDALDSFNNLNPNKNNIPKEKLLNVKNNSNK